MESFLRHVKNKYYTMSSQQAPANAKALATASGAPKAPPSLLNQVGMAGSAAVITVTFIHPIDVVKVSAI